MVQKRNEKEHALRKSKKGNVLRKKRNDPKLNKETLEVQQ